MICSQLDRPPKLAQPADHAQLPLPSRHSISAPGSLAVPGLARAQGHPQVAAGPQLEQLRLYWSLLQQSLQEPLQARLLLGLLQAGVQQLGQAGGVHLQRAEA